MNFSMITGHSLLELSLLLIALLASVRPMGSYLAKVYSGERVWLEYGLGWVEKLLYRIAGIEPSQEMDWKKYALAMLGFSFTGFLVLYAIIRLQAYLPLNPLGMANVSPHLAFNIAASFITNTNWQSYVPEQTLSIFSQMAGLAVQHFLSAALGMIVAIVLFRGFTRKNMQSLGNFWVDLTRTVLYVLLPLSLALALILGSQGVVQNFKTETFINQYETGATQKIMTGPVASQVAIKQLGTNGGGYFNANAAHPFENPTPLSNFLQIFALLLIPVSLCYTFGVMVKDRRQGWTILAAMTLLFLPFALFANIQEQRGNQLLASLNINQVPSEVQPGGNMEGKETRFGISSSTLWATATTATSAGAVNSMHDSYTALGGLVPLILMQFGEVIFGGAGSGIISMLIFAIVAVFIAGLMVGRTPEYIGKKLGTFEMKMAALIILIPGMLSLVGSAFAMLSAAGISAIQNPGAQGFSEILYAVTSAGNNNGSAFAGLSTNSPFYNLLLGLIMLMARFWLLIPALALAGALANKNAVPPSPGTLPTHTPLFVFLVMGVILLLGLLSFGPSLALGPIAEHLHLQQVIATQP